MRPKGRKATDAENALIIMKIKEFIDDGYSMNLSKYKAVSYLGFPRNWVDGISNYPEYQKVVENKGVVYNTKTAQRIAEGKPLNVSEKKVRELRKLIPPRITAGELPLPMGNSICGNHRI